MSASLVIRASFSRLKYTVFHRSFRFVEYFVVFRVRLACSLIRGCSIISCSNLSFFWSFYSHARGLLLWCTPGLPTCLQVEPGLWGGEDLTLISIVSCSHGKATKSKYFWVFPSLNILLCSVFPGYCKDFISSCLEKGILTRCACVCVRDCVQAVWKVSISHFRLQQLIVFLPYFPVNLGPAEGRAKLG